VCPRFHAEVAARECAENNAHRVTHKHIKYDVVPPTFVEVWQPVLERQLHQLKPYADGPRDAGVAEEDGLAPPAKEVAEDEDVERLFQVGPRAAAVLVVFFGYDAVNVVTCCIASTAGSRSTGCPTACN
jgi:hypothetical protein